MKSATPPPPSSKAPTSEVSSARRKRWAEIIAEEARRSELTHIEAWHHGSPGREVLDAPAPPTHAGRYNRAGGRATWYGSSSETGAWAEFRRALPVGVDPGEFPRRIGRVEFDLKLLDLTSP